MTATVTRVLIPNGHRTPFLLGQTVEGICCEAKLSLGQRVQAFCFVGDDQPEATVMSEMPGKDNHYMVRRVLR